MVKFQDPPSTNRKYPHDEIVAELKSRPGEWALVLEGVSASNAGNIQRGSVAAYQPAGSFQARSHRRTDGKFDIYARFVGEVSA